MTQPAQEHKPSQKAKSLSARLYAAQAVYQILKNGDNAQAVLEQYLKRAPDMEIDGEKIVEPDGALLKKILRGVEERAKDLESILEANLQKGKEHKSKLDPLLQAISLCASYELLTHQNIDSPIIINDYLNVTHAFYDQGEVNLMNGLLDSVAKVIRDV